MAHSLPNKSSGYYCVMLGINCEMKELVPELQSQCMQYVTQRMQLLPGNPDVDPDIDASDISDSDTDAADWVAEDVAATLDS